MVSITCFTAMEVYGMSFFKRDNVCLASAFEGKLTFKGKPAADARIVRTYKWKDDKGETEETTADKNGRFSFPAHWTKMRLTGLVQLVIHQEIFVYYKEQEYQIWAIGKLVPEVYSEFGGKPKNIRCEITDELRRVDLEHGFVGTSCYWDKTE